MMTRAATLIRCLAAGIALQYASAQAANIVVNSTADSGSACTLRNAMQNAVNNSQTNSGCAAGSGVDTITFDPAVFATPQTITVGSMLPQLTDTSTTTIDGGNKVTIDGGGKVQIFFAGNLSNGAGSTVLRNLVIANGNADGTGSNGYYGGGIEMVGTSLELDHVTFSGNTAKFGGGGFYTQSGTTTIDSCLFTGNTAPTGTGGGISTSANLIVRNSTFTGNSAGSGGSGIFIGGGTTAVTNSTFNGNSASYYGSAIRNFGGTALTLDYVTISGNPNLNYNGALDTEGSATTSVKNSIVAGNTTGFDCNIANAANFTDQGNNFFGDGTCSRTGNGNPMLASLGYTGGSTPTMSPLKGSPVLGAAACEATVTTDQRGVTRPQNGKCDIGAVEVEVPIFANGFE